MQDAAEIHDKLPLVLLLKARGWGVRRISARIGMTPKSVYSMIAKLHTQHADRQEVAAR
jgi:hypothetical protein